jgi:hypothetical protein
MRAVQLPVTPVKLFHWPRRRRHQPVLKAQIQPFTANRLRGGKHNLAHGQRVPCQGRFHNQLEQQCRALGVGVNERRKVRQVILVGRQVYDVVHALQRPR